MLREFLLEEIRNEEAPRLQAAQRQIDALYKPYYERGACGFNGPAEEVAERQNAWREAHDQMVARIDALPDPTALIVVDEADRLKMTRLEQVRDTFDRGGIGVVLIGMPGLEKRRARYPQLYSRVGFVDEFKPLPHADVRQLLRDRWAPADVVLPEEGLIDDDAIATVVRVIEGKFRLLHRLLTQIARVLEINGLDKVTVDVVKAARENLVIGTA
jgi:DNA transposition AAA+ family ATPase